MELSRYRIVNKTYDPCVKICVGTTGDIEARTSSDATPLTIPPLSNKILEHTLLMLAFL